ncbi:o-succinylbenzoate synthase [Lysinibacter cavernae]|uniref:o-succinylbenzoate synthase n=1 Tax=Lysinibacter cavernae TaxID=1640652 RepID=A0A7X5TSG5_9MICO|nr:o-succinylbenzoate synthase [Lysinibacter cavernae]NIH52238.1 O-succinylbenzoate synthase [Lysinibacter cavernae]
MRIVSADVHTVELPLVHSFETSSHRKRHLQHLLIRLVDEAGNEGWGEVASPSHPFFSPETTDTCRFILAQELLPSLLGVELGDPAEAPAAAIRTWAKVRGNSFARAGLESAVWDLSTRVAHVSLSAALGGTATHIEAGVSLGIEPTVEQLLETVAGQVEAGYGRIKLKIAPGWDVAPVRAVRERFGDIALHVDANGVYTEAAEHLAALTELDSYGLTMIEQPFAPANMLASARLQANIQTPICLDESVEEVDHLRTALRLDAGRVLNIKVSRMGGLSTAKEAHDVCRAAGIPVWCGGMHEFGVGRATNIALASLPGFVMPSDVSASAKYYARDITTEPIVAVQGSVAVPTGAGIGYTVDEAYVAERSTESFTLIADTASAR